MSVFYMPAMCTRTFNGGSRQVAPFSVVTKCILWRNEFKNYIEFSKSIFKIF